MYSVAALLLPAGYSAIFNATTPMMGVLIGWMCFSDSLTLKKGAGVLWGVMFLGERLSAAHLYGGGLICLAVWFVLSKSKPKQEPSPASD